mmetsp:Transcript_94276/g.184848  ORF Transcript_94276/g.184848 Transcript_94276/m.184848 type:complete len:236 (-) Transcript_94276:362-1069(-)
MAKAVGEVHEGVVSGLGLSSLRHLPEEPFDRPRDGLPGEDTLVGALLLHLDVTLPVVNLDLVLLGGVGPLGEPVEALDEQELAIRVRQPRHLRAGLRWHGIGVQLSLAHVGLLGEPCHAVDVLELEWLPRRGPCPVHGLRARLEECHAAGLHPRDLPWGELSGGSAAGVHGIHDDEGLARGVDRDRFRHCEVALPPHRACQLECLRSLVHRKLVPRGEVVRGGRVDGDGRRPVPI